MVLCLLFDITAKMEISKLQSPTNQEIFVEPWPVLVSRRATKSGHPSLEAEGKSIASPCKTLQQEERDELVAVSDLNAASIVASLNVCTKQRDLLRGIKLHTAFSNQELFQKNVNVGNSLLNMYAKCGALAKAQEVFDKLITRNVISWNVLIGGYAQHERGEEALNYYEQMQCEGFSPDAFTFSSVLKACGSTGHADKGRDIHSHIVRARVLEKDIFVANALVDMYAKCGLLEKAQEVFDEISNRDIVLWNALIAGYTQQGHGEKALFCFEQMQLAGFSPSAVTLVCILKACGSLRALEKGKELHAEIRRMHLLEKNILVANALIDMYTKCGDFKAAKTVFENLPGWDVVSWNGLITGYVEHGHGEEALKCYKQMQLLGFSPDRITILCTLKACGRTGDMAMGCKIHAQILRAGLLEKDSHVGTALVDMYAKCGKFEKAEEVFQQLYVWDVVSWNSLIAGYGQFGHSEEALECFEQMQLEGFSPSAASYSCILKACGSTGVACKGQIIHDGLLQDGQVEIDIVVGTALVDMYANCGMLAEAQDVFDELRVRNVVLWSALMVGFAQLGKQEVVAHLFENMIQDGTKPNAITFMVVLNSCSHGGLLDQGQMYFETISESYGIIPTLEHHVCMVDLFGRAGLLNEAAALLHRVSCGTLTAWHTLLGACQKWGNVKLGRWAFDNLVKMDDKDDSAYDCMRNIYIAARRPEDAKLIEAMRVQTEGRTELVERSERNLP